MAAQDGMELWVLPGPSDSLVSLMINKRPDDEFSDIFAMIHDIFVPIQKRRLYKFI